MMPQQMGLPPPPSGLPSGPPSSGSHNTNSTKSPSSRSPKSSRHSNGSTHSTHSNNGTLKGFVAASDSNTATDTLKSDADSKSSTKYQIEALDANAMNGSAHYVNPERMQAIDCKVKVDPQDDVRPVKGEETTVPALSALAGVHAVKTEGLVQESKQNAHETLNGNHIANINGIPNGNINGNPNGIVGADGLRDHERLQREVERIYEQYTHIANSKDSEVAQKLYAKYQETYDRYISAYNAFAQQYSQEMINGAVAGNVGVINGGMNSNNGAEGVEGHVQDESVKDMARNTISAAFSASEKEGQSTTAIGVGV